MGGSRIWPPTMPRAPRRAARSWSWSRRPPSDERPEAGTKSTTCIRSALARVSMKDAVGEVAVVTGLPRREIYQRALAIAKESGDGGR